MHFILRECDSQKKDVEFIIGVLLIPLFFIICFIVAVIIPDSFAPVCHMNQSFGIPCPACGSMRSLRLFADGNFVAAFKMQPFAIIGSIGLVVYSIHSYCVVFSDTRTVRLVDVSSRDKWLIGLATFAFVMTDWIYQIYS